MLTIAFIASIAWFVRTIQN